MKSHRTANCCAAGKRRLRRSTPRRRRRQASGRRRDALSPRPFFARVLVAECFFLAIPHSQKKTKTKDKRRCRRRSVPVTPQTPVPKLSVKKTDYRFAEICKKKTKIARGDHRQSPIRRSSASTTGWASRRSITFHQVGPGRVIFIGSCSLSLSLSWSCRISSIPREGCFFFFHPSSSFFCVLWPSFFLLVLFGGPIARAFLFFGE